MSRREDRLRREIGAFLKGYTRSSAHRNGMDPNDRHYSLDMEREVKRMSPKDLDRLIRDFEDDEFE